ncbi:MAG: hypothetical protein HYU53_07835 [Acidobacteria bacterium]|nr:hypothetical protein [Acidobacteriota bacterium]
MRRTRRAAPIALVIACLVLLVAASTIDCAGGAGRRFGRQYEYEEDVTLSLDGSAVVTINASIPALVALHGMALPVNSRTRIDRDDVRAQIESPVYDVTRVSRTWRRRGRRFIQIRLDVPDVRRLPEAPLFDRARYDLATREGGSVFRQRVGGGKRAGVPEANWDGSELVAFKLHLPSRIFHHNVRDIETRQTGEVERGNIVRWEQRLSDRLAGVPVEMEVRMDSESILNRTLWLFAGAFGAAMFALAMAIWWVVRRGRGRSIAPRSSQSLPQS